MPGVGFAAVPLYSSDFSGDPSTATWLPIGCSADTSLDMSATEVDVSTRLSTWETFELGLTAGSFTMTLIEKTNMATDDPAAQTAFDAVLNAAITKTPLAMWVSDNGDVVDSKGLVAFFYVHFNKDGPLNDTQAWNFTCRVHSQGQWYKKAGP